MQFYKLKNIKLAVVIFIGISTSLAALAGSNPSCEEILTPQYDDVTGELISQTKLDVRYRESVESAERTENQKAGAAINLLNMALTPLIEAYRESLAAKSDQDIRQILSQIDPILFQAKFSDGIAPRASQAVIRALRPPARAGSVKTYEMKKSLDMIKVEDQLYAVGKHPEKNFYDLGYLGERAIVTPIGEYGVDFARDSILAANYLMEIAVRELPEIADEVFATAPYLLSKEAARVRLNPRNKAYGTIQALVEGILSFHQLATMLLITKVDGVDTGPEALRLLVNSGETSHGLASEITMQIPLALVGPGSLNGYGFKNALELSSGGKLIASGALKNYLSQCRVIASNFIPKRVCPFSAHIRTSEVKETGIQVIARAYLRVFEIIRSRRSASN